MAGVIREDGTQLERCNCCGTFVELDNMGYQVANTEFPYGRDLCIKCVDNGIRSGTIQFQDIIPSSIWVAKEI